MENEMSKLLQDPKVAALVEKQVTAAVKANTKAIVAAIKGHEVADKVQKALVKSILVAVAEATS
jgi:CMP-2-keto-3-deoxyoctulosonic acid synthetase